MGDHPLHPYPENRYSNMGAARKGGAAEGRFMSVGIL